MAKSVLKTTPAQKASVGGLIVVALLILAVAVIILGGEKGFLSRRYELNARFTRISGLQTGAPVWLAGKKVGYVENIHYVRDQPDRVYVDVNMRINTDVSDLIRTDTEARISTLGLLGDKMLSLTMGSPDSAKLEPGDYVQTANPIDFEELITKGVETFEDLAEGGKSLKSIAAKLDTGAGTLGRLINSSEVYFDIERIAGHTESIAGKIDRNEGTVGRLFSDPKLYDDMVATLERVDRLVDTLEAGGGTLGRLVKDPALYDHLTTSLGRIDTLIARIERGEGTSGKLISSDELYRSLSGSVSSLDSLIKDIRDNPDKYFDVSVSIF